MARWKRVNEFVIKEARAVTPAHRLHELETLFAFAHSVGKPGNHVGTEEARQRWKRLRDLSRAG